MRTNEIKLKTISLRDGTEPSRNKESRLTRKWRWRHPAKNEEAQASDNVFRIKHRDTWVYSNFSLRFCVFVCSCIFFYCLSAAVSSGTWLQGRALDLFDLALKNGDVSQVSGAANTPVRAKLDSETLVNTAGYLSPIIYNLLSILIHKQFRPWTAASAWTHSRLWLFSLHTHTVFS